MCVRVCVCVCVGRLICINTRATGATHTDPLIPRECERDRERGERERDCMVGISQGSDDEQ